MQISRLAEWLRYSARGNANSQQSPLLGGCTVPVVPPTPKRIRTQRFSCLTNKKCFRDQVNKSLTKTVPFGLLRSLYSVIPFKPHKK